MVRPFRAATDRNPPTLGGGGCQVHYYKLTDIEALKVKREKQPEQRGRKKKVS